MIYDQASISCRQTSTQEISRTACKDVISACLNGPVYIGCLNVSMPFCSFTFLFSMEPRALSGPASLACSLDCLGLIHTPQRIEELAA